MLVTLQKEAFMYTNWCKEIQGHLGEINYYMFLCTVTMCGVALIAHSIKIQIMLCQGDCCPSW